MNEKEFDEILKNALKLEISSKEISPDTKIYSDNIKEANTMKNAKILKPIIVAACCAALVLGTIYIPGIIGNNKNSDNEVVSAIESAMPKSFTISAMAAGKKKELKKNVSVATRDSHAGGWGGDSETLEVYYTEEMPLICDGDNIEKITYSINKGAFQIFNRTGDEFILDGKKHVGDLNVGAVFPEGYDDLEEENGGKSGVGFDEEYYTSYTVDYDKQTGDGVQVNICDNLKVSKDTYKKMWQWGDNKVDWEDRSVWEKEATAMNEVLGDIVITCTVTYKDGTTEDKNIYVSAKVLSTDEVTGEKKPGAEKEYSIYTVYSLEK